MSSSPEPIMAAVMTEFTKKAPESGRKMQSHLHNMRQRYRYTRFLEYDIYYQEGNNINRGKKIKVENNGHTMIKYN